MRPSDSIADLLTRIRNACTAQQRFVDVPNSKMRVNVLKILKEEGFIQNFLVKEEGPQGIIRIFLKYQEGRKPVIQGLKRVSKPSMRYYVGYKKIPPVLGGMGVSILSTSQGLLSGKIARSKKVGGELLCYVW